MLIQLASWFEAHQWRYIAVSETLLLGFVGLVLAANFVPRLTAALETRRGRVALFAFAFLVVLAGRWPTLFVYTPLNVDEAQMVAQAITVPSDPVPWRGFDSGSSGPLNTYPLAVSEYLGVQASYLIARLIAMVLEVCAFAALFITISNLLDQFWARVAILPPIIFWSLSQQEDFVHYSSEQVPLFLAAVAIACVAAAWPRRYPPALLFGCGFCAGAMPFAKLQGAPLGAAIVVLAIVSVFGSTAIARPRKLAAIGALVAGSVTIPAVLIGVMLAGGSFSDFWKSYIISGLAYCVRQDNLGKLLVETPEFGHLFVIMGIATIVGLTCALFGFERVSVTRRNALFGAIWIAAASIYIIYAPGRNSWHYLAFAVLPMAGLATLSLATFAQYFTTGERSVRRGMIGVLYAGIVLVALGGAYRAPYRWLGSDFGVYMADQSIDPMIGALRYYLKPGEKLAIWGWRPQFWVYSNTHLGTRDSVSYFQFALSPLNPERDYFRKRFIDDFTRNKPEGFLDAGPESWDWNGTFEDGIEEFPEINNLLEQGYVMKATWRRYRFYLRADLATRSNVRGNG